MNLIPEQPGQTPSYWCTWGLQNYSLSEGLRSSEAAAWDRPARNLNERLLFEQPGWLVNFLEPVRGDLFVLFDAGWDLHPGADADRERWRFGSLEPDAEKFPSLSGSPAERLEQLNQRVKAAGWRGAGLWVSPQLPGEGRAGYTPGPAEVEQHWAERARWSRAAGIEYWKVDAGRHSGEADYRRRITQLARQEHPDLLVEHGISVGPFNDIPTPWDPRPSAGLGRFRSPDGLYERSLEFLAFSDVLRTYDVSAQLSVATTLDRVAQLLLGGRVEAGALGMLNCEDEVYLGAALGCALGVMRHPLWQPRPGMDYDPYQLRLRSTEVIRAVRWQRFAPAFAQGEEIIKLSRQVLYDRWLFQPGDSWAVWVDGEEIAQGAPAAVARGLPLPEVRADGRPPFVAAARHPNGAVAVAVLPRVLGEREIATPLADVTLELSPGTDPLAVFGRYRSLAILLDEPLGKRRLWAQDLAGDSAADITDRVQASEKRITLDGELLAEIGTSAQPPGDLSEPGLVLVLHE